MAQETGQTLLKRQKPETVSAAAEKSGDDQVIVKTDDLGRIRDRHPA